MPVHRRVAPCIKFVGTHLYTWVERGTMGVKGSNPDRSIRDERTNHEATAPPQFTSVVYIYSSMYLPRDFPLGWRCTFKFLFFQLRHPNVVKYHKAFQESEWPCVELFFLSLFGAVFNWVSQNPSLFQIRHWSRSLPARVFRSALTERLAQAT